MIAYTIAAAQQSGVFEDVVLCTDDLDLGRYGSVRLIGREPVSDNQPDIVWLRDAFRWFSRRPESFAILRATSPFRTAATIQRAYRQWQRECDCIDSLRAVTPASQTPYKMWTQASPGMPMTPLLPGAHPDGTPYHSSPTQTLPTVYVQTGGLEMGWTRNVEDLGTISGRKISPFLVEGPEALDLNTPRDWLEAERLLATGAVESPALPLARVSGDAATVEPPDSGRAVSRGSGV